MVWNLRALKLAGATSTLMLCSILLAPAVNADPKLNLNVDPADGAYETIVNGEKLQNPVSRSGDEGELVEVFDVRGHAVRSVYFGATPSPTIEESMKQTEASPDPAAGVTRPDGSFVRANSVESAEPELLERDIDTEVVDDDEIDPTFALAYTTDVLSVDWSLGYDELREYVVRVGGEQIASGTGDEVSASLPTGAMGQDLELVLVDPQGDAPSVTRQMTLVNPEPHFGARLVPGYQDNSTAFLHMTFIPESRVTLDRYQNMGCGEDPFGPISFGGNNRSWHLPTNDFPLTAESVPSFKTLAFVYANWQNATSNILQSMVGVGATTKYDNGEYLESRRASSDGIELLNPQASRSYAQVVINHQVGNPFCSIGSITYHETLRMYRDSGLVEVVGWRRPVPNHELYIRTDKGGGSQRWATLSRRGNEGFNCLMGNAPIVGGCARDSFSLSNR